MRCAKAPAWLGARRVPPRRRPLVIMATTIDRAYAACPNACRLRINPKRSPLDHDIRNAKLGLSVSEERLICREAILRTSV